MTHTINTRKGSYTGTLRDIVEWQCKFNGAMPFIDGIDVSTVDFESEIDVLTQTLAKRLQARALEIKGMINTRCVTMARAKQNSRKGYPYWAAVVYVARLRADGVLTWRRDCDVSAPTRSERRATEAAHAYSLPWYEGVRHGQRV